MRTLTFGGAARLLFGRIATDDPRKRWLPRVLAGDTNGLDSKVTVTMGSIG